MSKEKIHGKTLKYWKKNAEEDYLKVPISVLKYITCLEEKLKQLELTAVVQQSEQYCECDKPRLGKSISRCGTCDEWFKPLK